MFHNYSPTKRLISKTSKYFFDGFYIILFVRIKHTAFLYIRYVCMYGSTHDDMGIRKIDIFLFSIISLKYSERKVTIVTIIRIFLISVALKRLLL